MGFGTAQRGQDSLWPPGQVVALCQMPRETSQCPALHLLLFHAALLPRVHFVLLGGGILSWSWALWVAVSAHSWSWRCGTVPHMAQFRVEGIVQQLGLEMLGFYTYSWSAFIQLQ